MPSSRHSADTERKFALTKAQVRLAQSAMAHRDTSALRPAVATRSPRPSHPGPSAITASRASPVSRGPISAPPQIGECPERLGAVEWEMFLVDAVVETHDRVEAVQQPVGVGGISARLELPEPDEPRRAAIFRASRPTELRQEDDRRACSDATERPCDELTPRLFRTCRRLAALAGFTVPDPFAEGRRRSPRRDDAL